MHIQLQPQGLPGGGDGVMMTDWCIWMYAIVRDKKSIINAGEFPFTHHDLDDYDQQDGAL